MIQGTFNINTAMSAKELAEKSDVILFALPTNGHKSTMDAIAPHIEKNQSVIISSHASLIEIVLSNTTNPEAHLGIVLCNLTRMEQSEDWCQRKNVTPAVGRLIETLDLENLRSV